MQLKNWWASLLAKAGWRKQHFPGFDTYAAAQTEQAEEIEGLNFRKAVDVHQVWKNRLHNYVIGKEVETLTPEDVADVNQCLLGAWMTQIGNSKYGKERLYQKLQAAHQEFHDYASHIVLEHQRGNSALALQMLSVGEYPAAGLKIVSLLARLYHRCQSGVI